MYLRLRKRKKPLPTDPNSPAAVDASVEPATGPGELPSSPTSDWVPAEPNQETPGDSASISTPRHPNRGKARESARGSHR
ncbi:hypothetical protein [Piscinibacter sp. HJYY11]|uniref:hypothetical protein n=1 Tax=Piscinibacter sp. HJYY11 TaxID=2801333 RepID=UPI00191E4275|nr:hypothetical protein [Piscinibacter sp. HJYY11]MBL0726491.1 hypothetical protein [Piscinibacter sp. HJYY11]